jgi:hypothetical protein
MQYVIENSLSRTIDNVNDAFFSGQKINKSEKEKVSKYISTRFDLPRSYRGLFAPDKGDRIGTVNFFTGEPIKSGVSIAHILSEDSIRVLKLMNSKKAGPRDVLKESTVRLREMLAKHEEAGYIPGMFCCGNCSTALWQNLAALKISDTERLLDAGMKYLKASRTGTGQWRNFPFYQTALVLTEIETTKAKKELKYAAPAFERAMKRKQNVSRKFQKRLSILAERVLALV